MNYEYKCEICKRPAETKEVSQHVNQGNNLTYTHKQPERTCSDVKCGGKIVLMWD